MQIGKMKRTYTLIDLWKIFVRWLWAIVLAAVIVVSCMAAFVSATFRPIYSSVATLYVLRQENSLNESNIEDFSLALNVVNDCTYLLKSHAVLDEVIEQLSLNIPYEQLSRMITTSNPTNTRILEVRVAASSPEEAKMIVDCVCKVGSQRIEEAMGFKQVNLYEYGTLEKEPSNRGSRTTYLLAGLFAAIFTYLLFVIYSLFDTSLHTDEEIEELLGVSIIGDIPNADTHKSRHYGYYGNKADDKGETAGKKEETAEKDVENAEETVKADAENVEETVKAGAENAEKAVKADAENAEESMESDVRTAEETNEDCSGESTEISAECGDENSDEDAVEGGAADPSDKEE